MMLRDKILRHPWFPRRSAEYFRWYPMRLDAPADVERLRSSTFQPIEGIYIHVPFCHEICTFCPFNKRQVAAEGLARYLAALKSEVHLYGELASAAPEGLSFVYFGGGTPSVLSPALVGELLSEIDLVFGIGNRAEITLEIHPTDVHKEYLLGLRSAGISRLSTGIQSFSEPVLRRMGATHSAVDSQRCIELIPMMFDNWGLDLLYRCVGQTAADWGGELNTLLGGARPTHVSCYSLALPDASSQPAPSEDVDLGVRGKEVLEQAGYVHYASCATGGFDYCLPGFKCKYEDRHWGAPQASYLAIGAGALGFVGEHLTVNLHDVSHYCQRTEAKQLPLLATRRAEGGELKRRYFVLGVKTLEVDLNPFRLLFGIEPQVDFSDLFEQLDQLGLARVSSDLLALTDVGSFFVDQISEAFWSVEEGAHTHPETHELKKLERKFWVQMEQMNGIA